MALEKNAELLGYHSSIPDVWDDCSITWFGDNHRIVCRSIYSGASDGSIFSQRDQRDCLFKEKCADY